MGLNIFLYNMTYKFKTDYTIEIKCDSNLATNLTLIYTGAILEFPHASPDDALVLKEKVNAKLGYGPFSKEDKKAIRKIKRIG